MRFSRELSQPVSRFQMLERLKLWRPQAAEARHSHCDTHCCTKILPQFLATASSLSSRLLVQTLACSTYFYFLPTGGISSSKACLDQKQGGAGLPRTILHSNRLNKKAYELPSFFGSTAPLASRMYTSLRLLPSWIVIFLLSFPAVRSSTHPAAIALP